MTNNDDDIEKKTKQVLARLNKEERVLLKKVIEAEKERLSMKTPHGIYDTIKESVENIVQ
ncbi:hypothetical protein [Salinibacter sp.]|uniref:hypothetical protein n=1 Tax=Salinibacter sp. TaxID=2065818 RepID=UPI0021E9480B|nr:hypothetical protein [Salinibacter sp.]